MTRKTERDGLKLQLVNPAYSSVGGFVKYGYKNKLQVDVAASLWIARQAHFGGEYFKVGHASHAKITAEKAVPHASFNRVKKEARRGMTFRTVWGNQGLFGPRKYPNCLKPIKTLRDGCFKQIQVSSPPV